MIGFRVKKRRELAFFRAIALSHGLQLANKRCAIVKKPQKSRILICTKEKQLSFTLSEGRLG